MCHILCEPVRKYCLRRGLMCRQFIVLACRQNIRVIRVFLLPTTDRKPGNRDKPGFIKIKRTHGNPGIEERLHRYWRRMSEHIRQGYPQMTGALTKNRSELTNKNKSFIIIVQPQRRVLSMIMSFINDYELERNLNL